MSSDTTLLSEIHKMLVDQGRPLSASEMAGLIKNDNLNNFESRYISSSIRSALSRDILDRKEQSLFARFSKGVYGLRSWLESEDYREYQPPKRKKKPIDEVIAVIPNEKLNLLIPAPGFYSNGIPERIILNEFESCVRHKAEEDLDLIQFVSVFIVHDGKRIITHKRAKRLPESRLHDEYSVMFGGHILSEDLSSLFNPFDVVSQLGFIVRELEEEVLLSNSAKITPIGLIYDDSRDVSRQHIGLVFTARTDITNYSIGEKGFLVDHQVETVSEISERINDFENWSATLINNFEQILRTESGNKNGC